jgi:DMSO/TMAO reductase YedYZ molybdopterin-dependent catalytic subunit
VKRRNLKSVTPRATDWGLALLVGLLFVTGVMSLFAGRSGDAWVFAVHGAGGFALGGVLVWKGRRVLRRLVRPWDRGTAAGAGAAAFVAVALLSGWAWSSGVQLSFAGYNLLNWHFALGTALALVVLGHALLRGKPLRRVDIAGRRQFLSLGAVALGAYAAWWMQRPVGELLQLRGAQRRFTGSYERSSFTGNDFPTTSWVADNPRVLDSDEWRLEVTGLVERPLELTLDELDSGDEWVATLDCTGGFYSRQRWLGIALERVLSRARPLETATHLRVISHTGYRWGFELGELDDLLLATHVGDEELVHGHGAPLRLVARNRRGFQWVKWVVRIELHDGPDRGAAASTVWSSFTDEGRGAA